MRILKIRFKNLASLEDINEIDFTTEPLSQAGIFAITGPTGAGKSTLLDALCLALYAKTPRYQQAKETGIEIQDVAGNKINQGDIRGILRDGTADGFAEVEFIGIDGLKYKATWTVRRANNKIDRALQADTIQLTDLSTNTVIAAKKTETLKHIENKIGLTFDQFTRAVLLAQGDFTAFLKADKDEKASLLEKLTGTDVYSDISRLIFEKYKQAANTLHFLKEQMAGISLLTDEEQQTLNEEKATLDTVVQTHETLLANLQSEINWHNTHATLIANGIQAEKELLAAQKSKEDAAAQITTFFQVENVQSARSLIDAKATAQVQLEAKSRELQTLSTYIQHITTAHITAVEQLEKANKEVSDKQQEEQDLQPVIVRARTLDTLITEKSAQVTIAQQEAKIAVQQMEEHTALLQGKEAEKTTLSGTIAQLHQWATDHTSRKNVAENIILITAKLTEAEKLFIQQSQCRENIRTTNTTIKETIAGINTLKDNVQGKQQNHDQLNKEYHILKEEIAAIPINDLKNKEAQLDQAVPEYTGAKGHWALLFTNLQEQQAQIQKYNACDQAIVTNSDVLKNKQQLLHEAIIKKDHSDKTLSQAQLKISQNVEALRSALIHGESCPVCGSIEHPHSGSTHLLKELHREFKKENEECHTIYATLLREESSLQEQGNRLTVDKSNFKTAIDKRATIIQSLEQQWQSFKIDTVCFNLPEAERTDWLEQQAQSLQSAQAALTIQLDAYTNKKAAADKQKELLDQLNHDLLTAKELLKDKQREEVSQTEEITRLQSQLKQDSTTLSDIINQLNAYFVAADWAENWKKDTTRFIAGIQAFAERWKTNAEQIATNNQQLQILQATLDGLHQQTNPLSTGVKDKTAHLTGLQEQLSSLQDERKTLLQGADVLLFEQQLKAAIATAITVQQTFLDKAGKLKEEVLKSNTSIAQINRDITEITATIEKCHSDISSWLEEYANTHPQSITLEELVQLLHHPKSWIDSERKVIQAIRDAVTKSKATFDERCLQLTTHENKKISDKSLEELTLQHESAKKLLDDKVNVKNDIVYKLRLNEENKKKSGHLLQEIAAKNHAYENWSKLSDLLGSADGKKFRQIAQEYTLDILLGYANIQLQMLTNRYKLLRVPGNLGLQVVDKDMGDELRTVFSLSGGESFLVSLALALGLASLSSSTMKVESLFIDEGFGALDPDTLHIAMDALERLHHQGRKVGVISHVQEMTDRIPTQIRVSKLSSGKSKIDIVGTVV
jgi:exonuclease SbcC